jgi:hypothetical protein
MLTTRGTWQQRTCLQQRIPSHYVTPAIIACYKWYHGISWPPPGIDTQLMTPHFEVFTLPPPVTTRVCAVKVSGTHQRMSGCAGMKHVWIPHDDPDIVPPTLLLAIAYRDGR